MKKNQVIRVAAMGLLTLSLCGGASIFGVETPKQILAQAKMTYNQADDVLKAAKHKVTYLEKSIKLINEDIKRTNQYEETKAKAILQDALNAVGVDLIAAEEDLKIATTEFTKAKQLFADAKSGKRTENAEIAKAFFKKMGDKFKNLKKVPTETE